MRDVTGVGRSSSLLPSLNSGTRVNRCHISTWESQFRIPPPSTLQPPPSRLQTPTGRSTASESPQRPLATRDMDNRLMLAILFVTLSLMSVTTNATSTTTATTGAATTATGMTATGTTGSATTATGTTGSATTATGTTATGTTATGTTATGTTATGTTAAGTTATGTTAAGTTAAGTTATGTTATGTTAAGTTAAATTAAGTTATGTTATGTTAAATTATGTTAAATTAAGTTAAGTTAAGTTAAATTAAGTTAAGTTAAGTTAAGTTAAGTTAAGTTAAATTAAVTTATATTAAPTTNPPLITNTTVIVLQTPVNRTGCGTQLLCGSEPSDCNPSLGSCSFVSVQQTSSGNSQFALSGESSGYIAVTVSTDATVGDGDPTYVCANDNSKVRFFSAVLENNALTLSELPVNSVEGRVDGNQIQCVFLTTVSSRARAPNAVLEISTGSYNSTSQALGTPNSVFRSNVVNLGNPNATLTNQLTNTTTAPTTAHGVTFQQSLMRVLLVSVGVFAVAMA